jgi:uncharacterized membrane protein YbhN (UPF0104 family)
MGSVTRGLAVEAKKVLRTLVFTLLTLAVLAALLWFGDVHRVLAEIGRFQLIYLLWFVLVLIAHEAVRGLLWYLLVQVLAPRVPLRTRLFAFAAGEAIRFLPTGTYVQNYVMQRSQKEDFGHSSAATTTVVVAEIVAGLLGVVVLGVGIWSGGLRIGIVVVAALVPAAVWAVRRVPHVAHVPRRLLRYRRVRQVIEEIRRFRIGAAELAHPRIIAVTLLLSILYVGLAGVDLYLVIVALGIGGISLWQAIAVSCFGLAFYVVLGSLEAADVGVLIGLGVSKSAAVSAILVNRALSIGATAILALVVMAVLFDEWRAVIR